MATQSILERPLGPQEALFGEMTRRANGAIQLVCIAEFARRVGVGALRKALKIVHERHPMLRARMEDRDRIWWRCDVPFERIDIREQVTGPDFDLEAFYGAEAERPIELSRVSWRAVLLTNGSGETVWLALVTNHAAIDGRSALVVLNDLDVAIDDAATLASETLPLMPPAEAGLAAAGIAGEGGLYRPWPDDTLWAVERPASSTARRPRAFLRSVPQPALDALHDRVRREGCTLAAAFCAAAARAAGALPGSNDWIGILATTDVRGDCRPPVPRGAVGEYVASISLLLGPEQRDESLMATVRRLSAQLKENRPPALRMDTDVSPSQTREQADGFARATPRFPSGICVSDVGELDRLSGRPVGISRVLLMPSQNHGAHPIMVAIVSTSNGASLSFGYDEPLRSRESALAFAERYVEALAALSGAEC